MVLAVLFNMHRLFRLKNRLCLPNATLLYLIDKGL